MKSTFDLLNGVEALFGHMPGSLFFVKDREGRYLDQPPCPTYVPPARTHISC
ncbi:hypothetical protein N9N41_03515 [Opitutales bacterium]|nr:hypothetical protein [Opitutales bacterium]